MMRFAPLLGNHCCQTLSGVVVRPSLAISTEQIHARTTTELCRPAWRTLLQTGDEGLAVPDNRGSVETDLRPLNLGLTSAKRRTQDRAAWRRLVATATSNLTSCWREGRGSSEISWRIRKTPAVKRKTAGYYRVPGGLIRSMNWRAVEVAMSWNGKRSGARCSIAILSQCWQLSLSLKTAAYCSTTLNTDACRTSFKIIT